MTPTVAIIIRTKDRPTLLTRALANIAAQTFTDYAVWVVNDGGSKKQAKGITEASTIADKVTLLHTDGIGMEAASNLAISRSESTYIAIHDDDDLWAPEFLERTVRELEDSGAGMCTVRIIERFERETPHGFEMLEERIFHEGIPLVGLQFLYRTNRAVPIGILYRRELYKKLGGYRDELAVVGDWEFNMRAAAVGEIITLDEPLAYWCQRPESTGASANSIARQAEHRYYDSLVRAEEIRKDIASGSSPGPYLYQAHLANELDGRIIEGHELTREVLTTLQRLDAAQKEQGERLERIEQKQQEQGERLARIERALSWRSRTRSLVKIIKRGK